MIITILILTEDWTWNTIPSIGGKQWELNGLKAAITPIGDQSLGRFDDP